MRHEIAIVGAGRAGTALGWALARAGHPVKALSCLHLESAKESRRVIGQGKPMTDNRLAARLGSWIIIAVPDDRIRTVAEELGASGEAWGEKFVFHCSGLHPASDLEPLKKRGALTASIHPVQSFPRRRPSAGVFDSVYFGIEADKRSLRTARKVVRDIGGRPIILDPETKPLYHAACSMASNFFVTLLDTASGLLEESGVPKKIAAQILFPLVQGTLQNVKKISDAALTGPLVRGDIRSVKAHLEALASSPAARDVYLALARATLDLTRRQGRVPEKALKELRALLEEK
ncbi:MAG: Rossmann-like and DUF2520 domain-containing protein [Candidatus Aminicenantales bacterium]